MFIKSKWLIKLYLLDMEEYKLFDLEFQDCDAPNVRPLSDEVIEVFGDDIPRIDLFQTAHGIIAIPREIMSEIIYKGNPMRLFGVHFSDGKQISSAFDETLEHLQIYKEEIIDCVVGIFIGKGFKISATFDIAPFIKHLETVFPANVEPIWGFYIMEDKTADFAQVITVATKKREPLQDTPFPF